MGSSIKALHLLKPATDSFFFNFTKNGISSLPVSIKQRRSYSMKSSVLEPPDVPRLAETARISLTPQQVIIILFIFNLIVVVYIIKN